MFKFYIFILSFGVLIFSFVNLSLEKPKDWSAQDLDLSYVTLTSGNPGIDSLNIDIHYKFINQHFARPFFSETPTGFVYRDDKSITAYYESYVQYPEPTYNEIGNFGLGVIYSRQKQYELSNDYFNKVQNKNLRYLNNERGIALLNLGYSIAAVNSFKRAISLNEKSEEIYQNLSEALYHSGQFSELNKLIYKSGLNVHWNDRILNDLNFTIGAYSKYLLKRFKINVEYPALIASVLIGLIWLIFLMQLSKVKIRQMLLALGIVIVSMGTSFLCFILYDFYRLNLGFTLNGKLFNDFLYCFLGIGLIEEFVKALPLLCIFLIPKDIIEKPIHLFLYAGASAIGFSTVENLFYFDSEQLSIIHSRGLMCVISHIFDISVLVYVVFIASQKGKSVSIKSILIGLLLAALSHGIYDFWLLNKYADYLYLYTYIFMGLSMFIWVYFINNAINLSGNIEQPYKINQLLLKQYLIFGLFLIIMIEYLLNGFINGADTANSILYNGLIMNVSFLIFISFSLTNIEELPGYIAPFNFNVFTSKMNQSNFLRKEMLILSPREGSGHDMFPISGQIVSKTMISGDYEYFIFTPSSPIKYEDSYITTLILKSSKGLSWKQKLQKNDVNIFVPMSQLKPLNDKEDFKLLNKGILKFK